MQVDTEKEQRNTSCRKLVKIPLIFFHLWWRDGSVIVFISWVRTECQIPKTHIKVSHAWWVLAHAAPERQKDMEYLGKVGCLDQLELSGSCTVRDSVSINKNREKIEGHKKGIHTYIQIHIHIHETTHINMRSILFTISV